MPEASEESSTIADRDSISSGNTIVAQGQVKNNADTQDPFLDSQARPRLVYHGIPLNPQPTPSYPPFGYPNLQNNGLEETYEHSRVLEPMDTGYSHATSEWDQTNAGSVDHFNHDTEAYASGLASRPSYRPPRSRSPTPAVDEEDYHIIGNNSVHFTGHSPSPNRQASNQIYDKIPLEAQIGHDMSYQAQYMYEDDDGPYEDFDDEYDEDDKGDAEDYPYDASEKVPQPIAPPPVVEPNG